jgi:hypothetical protein
MVMVKYKLEICDRYVVKERGQHRDRCQSIQCAYNPFEASGLVDNPCVSGSSQFLT